MTGGIGFDAVHLVIKFDVSEKKYAGDADDDYRK
jgi:hypothetical protein